MQGKGAIFRNKKKTDEVWKNPDDRLPHYTGFLEPEGGEKLDIAVWLTKSKKGTDYMFVKFGPRQTPEVSNDRPVKDVVIEDIEDEPVDLSDIPF